MASLSVRDALDVATSALPAAEDRPGQRAMADAVDDAIRHHRHLIVQAGTGTGKTLGYLVPLVVNGSHVVVTTATKALQDQIARKDLPLLATHLGPALGRDITWAVLKGRSNYVCRQRVAETLGTAGDSSRKKQGVLDLDDVSAAVRRAVERVGSWMVSADSGEIADLPWSIDRATESAITVSSDECPGARRCPVGADCFAERARLRASEADIVIVNTHLYGLDIAAEGALLPEHDVVVVDEVHGLEDIMSDSVGASLSAGRYSWFLGIVRRIVADDVLVNRLRALGDDLSARLSSHLGRRLPVPLSSDFTGVLADTRLVVGQVLDALRAIESKDDDTDQRKLRAQQAANRFAETLDFAMHLDDSHVAFVSGGPNQPQLEIAPLEVGPVLAASVWSQRTAILTSATVPTNLPQRVGLPDESYEVIDVGSPFDYENNALLYCPSGFPNPNSDQFTARVHDELERLIIAAGGRTLALFTSYRALDAAVEHLRPRLPFRVISQRDHAQRGRAIDEFVADESSCLFATSGFFQGIDIPGRTLSLVTIDRIPFPRPDDPLLSARRDLLGDDAFREIDLPRAATLLAQAAGRLIRTDRDRGVVAVFDPRLATAGYRRQILAALPPMRRTIDRSQVIDFLRHVTD